jgi:hypothetical protein
VDIVKKWLITILVVVVLAGMAASAGWWFPPLLGFVGANSDLIQGLTDLIQLGLWGVTGLAAVVGLWRSGRREPATSTVRQTKQRSSSKVTAQDQAAVTSQQVTVGRDVQGDVIIVAEPRQLWAVMGRREPPADLQETTRKYLAYVVDRYRYLDFKGMGVTDRVPLRLPLVEMYVPLKARVELPEGDTWARHLRLAGRRVTPEEAEVMGQRLSEPQPVLELLGQHNGLIILGDPGAGKTTFLKYLALRLAMGEGEALGLAGRLPVLLPLSAYAIALAEDDIPLDRFIADYYRERGLDLPLGSLLAEALKQGGALLLLDGLDEVKELGQRRVVVDRVVDFFTACRRQGAKFILTSRVVGYREVRPVVEGLTECTLVDFGDEEVAEFVEKWTGAVERAARGQTALAGQAAAQERQELMAAIEGNPSVRTLAANPLLLTILALMKRQGISLPERRVELYQKYVETLLKSWNLARGLDRPPSRDLDVVETTRLLAPWRCGCTKPALGSAWSNERTCGANWLISAPAGSWRSRSRRPSVCWPIYGSMPACC